MDDGQEQDQYEERLKDVFNGFDASGTGSLCPEELSDLCQSLQLDDATPALLHALLQNQDRLTARVDFDQFKNALILVLSSSMEAPPAEQETLSKPESPEIQPKFVKGSKRYGRRSTPEFTEAFSSDLSEVRHVNPVEEENLEDNYDSEVPRKRERWNAHDTSTEEYEAEGQMHLWNPDEPSTPRGSHPPWSCSEERLRGACRELAIAWDGPAGPNELLALCEHLGLEPSDEELNSLTGDGVINVQEFVSRVVGHNKPPTPSASTPYRQLKRYHSTQPFDEGGRRIATPSALTSTIGTRLFSTLDDGSGFTPVEHILDAWLDEGIENSSEILQALNFGLDGKLSLSDLTVALENELLVTKNGIHQAALASFKAEIRHLLERVDRELREKQKIRSDLEKAERLKTQLATEVDEHHSAIERSNTLNLRKLEQEHREKLSTVRSELMMEMEQLQQQAGLQREELEAEVQKIKEDESFLRDHLSISVQENRRLEAELLDGNDKLLEAQSQVTKLQRAMDNIMKERFGDLDPGSAEFLLQEERIKHLRVVYEAQFRELQDRIDELQSELQEVHGLGRAHQACPKPLSEELESKSPGMESDPGIGPEEVQPFSMSLEVEMMLEQLKDRHLQKMEDLQNQLESKSNEFEELLEKQRASHGDQEAALALRYQQEVQTLREEMATIRSRLERAELERTQAEEREGLMKLKEEEAGAFRQELSEAHTYAADLEETLKTVEARLAEREQNLISEVEELRKRHADEIKKLEECVELSEGRLEEERKKLREDKVEMEKRLLDDFEQEKNLLQQRHEEELTARLEEVNVRSEEDRDEVVQRLTEQWQRERAQLDEQNNESLQELLEEEMLRLVREQEEKESKLREEWESQQAQLQENHLHRLLQDRLQLQEQFEQREKRLKEEWERERLQLEEDYEGMLQERLGEERERFETEREEQERRRASLMAEERAGLEESHREAVKELTTKHTEERDALSGKLEELRDDFTQERREIQFSFSQRIKEVEDRFSGDQESVHRRLQADVAELERHYQRQLEALSESLVKQKRHWEARVGEALENAEEQRRMMEQKQESLDQKWRKEVAEQERLHLERMEEHVVKNQQLQNELEDLISSAQTKEIELSRQLNDLHNRLQESRESGDQLLAQSEKKALETELLLHQTVEDFRHEREELLSRRSELKARNNEMLSITERQSRERIDLLTERDDLKMKIEELEMLLKRAAEELERKEQQEPNSSLEFRDNGETSRDELMAEINVLKIRIMELEVEIKQGLSFSTEAQKEADELITLMEETTETSPLPPGISLTGDNPLGFSEQEVANYFLSPSQTEQEPPDVLESRSDDSCEGYDENVHCNQGDGELEVMMDPTGGEEHSDGHSFVTQNDSTRPERDPEASWSAEFTHESFHIPFPDSQEPDKNTSNIGSDVSQEMQFEMLSSLEGFEGIDADEDGEDKVESCEEESKSQDVPAMDPGRPSHEEEPRHETVVDPSELEEMVDPGGPSVVDAEVTRLRDDSHDCGVELLSDCEHLTVKIRGDSLETGEDADWDDGECALLKLQALCNAASGQNLLLHEKISLLQQKTELLEDLLAHNSKKIQTGHQILEENYDLRVKTLLLMERVKELEMKASMTTRLHLRYEDCVCENAKLKDRNGELEKRVWSLECRMCLFQHLHDHPLLEEFCRMGGENSRSPTEESLLDRSRQVEVRVQTPTDLEEHAYLPGAVTELQDQWQTLNDTTRFPRNKAGCLTEENLVLREKLTTLKEEELQETQEELIQTLEHFKKWKMAAQEAEEVLKRQVSELCLQNQQLGAENRTLSEKDARHAAEAENLRRQLSELTKEHEKREAFPAQEKTELAACVCALEAELTKALEDSAQLEERNARLTLQLSGLGEKAVDVDFMESQLSHIEEEQRSAQEETRRLHHQLVEAEEKAKTLDEGLQAASHQSARLKSDLRVVQQERDSFKRDVSVLHKQLQNVKEKNHVLEQAMHSSGLHNQSKKRYREEISRLMEQDQQLLRQENEGLQAEVRDVKQELVQSRVKVRQLDAAILSLRQHKQSSVKALEQENASLKQELEAQKERAKAPEGGQEQAVLESLQQENEALRTQMSRLSTQLFDTFQAHFAGLLPSSPHRMPRAQHRGEELENAQQDERARKMKNMEERMREIELSLRNVKLLLKEKVSQLKEQLHKNGKADVLISDLYVENAQLLKALEVTEQRQKIAEKKNYLLEEKISSLNKIVRDLKPTPLPALPYHYSCS